MEDLHGTIKDDGTPKHAPTLLATAQTADAAALPTDKFDSASNANVQTATFHDYINAPNAIPATAGDTAPGTSGTTALPGMELTNTSASFSQPTNLAPSGFQNPQDKSATNAEILNPPANSIFQFATYSVLTDALPADHHATAASGRNEHVIGVVAGQGPGPAPAAHALENAAAPQPFQFASFTQATDSASLPIQQTLTHFQQIATNSGAPASPNALVVGNAEPVLPKNQTFQFATFNVVTDRTAAQPASVAQIAQPVQQSAQLSRNAAAAAANSNAETNLATTPVVQTPAQLAQAPAATAKANAPEVAIVAAAPAAASTTANPLLVTAPDNSSAPAPAPKPSTFQFASYNVVTDAAAAQPAPVAQIAQAVQPGNQLLRTSATGTVNTNAETNLATPPVVQTPAQLAQAPAAAAKPNAPEVAIFAAAPAAASTTANPLLVATSDNSSAPAPATKPATFQFASYNVVTDAAAAQPAPVAQIAQPVQQPAQLSRNAAAAANTNAETDLATTPVVQTPAQLAQAPAAAAKANAPEVAIVAAAPAAASTTANPLLVTATDNSSAPAPAPKPSTFQFASYNVATDSAVAQPAPVAQIVQPVHQPFQPSRNAAAANSNADTNLATTPVVQTPTQLAQGSVAAAKANAPEAAVVAAAPAPKASTFQFASYNVATDSAAAQPALVAQIAQASQPGNQLSRNTGANTNAETNLATTPIFQTPAQLAQVPAAAAKANAPEAAVVAAAPAPKTSTFQFASYNVATDSAEAQPTPVAQIPQASQPGNQLSRNAGAYASAETNLATTPVVQTPAQLAQDPAAAAKANAPEAAVAADAPAPASSIANSTQVAASDNSSATAPKAQSFQFASFNVLNDAAISVPTAQKTAAFRPAPIAQPMQNIQPTVTATALQPAAESSNTLARQAVNTSANDAMSLDAAKRSPLNSENVASTPAGPIKSEQTISALNPTTAPTNDHAIANADHAGIAVTALTAMIKTAELPVGPEPLKTVESSKLTGSSKLGEATKLTEAGKPIEIAASGILGATKTTIAGPLLGEHTIMPVGPGSKSTEETVKGTIKLLPTEIAAIAEGSATTKVDSKVVIRLGDILISTIKSSKQDQPDETASELSTNAKIVPPIGMGASGTTSGANAAPSQTSVTATMIDPNTGLPISLAQFGQNSLPGLQIMDGNDPVKADKHNQSTSPSTSTSGQRTDIAETSAADGIIATGKSDDNGSGGDNGAETRKPQTDEQDLIVSTQKPEGRGKKQIKDPDEKDLGAKLQAIFDGARGKFGRPDPTVDANGESKYDPEKTSRHKIAENETLESIAELLFDDSDLAGLLYEINSGFWKSRKKKGKIALIFGAGATIFLPTKKEIEAYRLRMRLSTQPPLEFEYIKVQSTTSLRQLLQEKQQETLRLQEPEPANIRNTGSPTQYFSTEVLRISRPGRSKNTSTNTGANTDAARQLQAKRLQAVTQSFIPDLKQHLDNIDQNSRIVIDAPAADRPATYFNARVEYCHQGQWTTVLEYQCNQDFAVLLAYKGNGQKQKVDLNLPMEVLREMAETDLQNNRIEYCRKFVLGRRILV